MLGEDIIEALELLGYPQVESLITNGSPRSLTIVEFSAIINWLSNELSDMLLKDNTVSVISGESKLDSFREELNLHLRELQSPFVDCDLTLESNRLAIINYYCGELMAARILHVNKPAEEATKSDVHESETARELKASMISLGIGKPPANVQSFQLFTKMQSKISEKLKGSALDSEEPLLFSPNIQLQKKDWKTIDKIHYSLFVEYTVRRKTLITRCDCTVASLKWKAGKKTEPNLSKKIDDSYGELRVLLEPKPNVCLAHALAARKSNSVDLNPEVNPKSHAICDIEIPRTKEKTFIGKQQRIFPQKFMIFNGTDRGGRHKKQSPPSHQEPFQHPQSAQRQPARGGVGGNQRGLPGSFQQRHKSHSEPMVQYQQRNQPILLEPGIPFQASDQLPIDDTREQFTHFEDPPYQHLHHHHQQQQHQQSLQYYCDQCFYPPSHHPTGQFADNYVQVFYQQAFFEQSFYEQSYYPQLYYDPSLHPPTFDTHRGGFRGRKGRRGGGNSRGGYQVFGRGGGRAQSVTWNQGN